ncbi:MAG: TetR/AcrR family transcriptional regulator, partial [Gammaproteobacteria bacterium]|nr:TetR/AcrR family transcriptional regulator [Gammaproteobacteria bacterium]
MANGVKQSRATRESLEDQLVTVFKKRGYEGATLNQLADATGLSKASLYHHFPG